VLRVDDWTDEELEAFDLEVKGGREPDPIPPPRPHLAHTLYMAPRVTRQIVAYQRQLQRVWSRTIRQLADLAESPLVNRPGGYQVGFERGDVIVDQATADFLAIAHRRYERAFETGQALAVDYTGRSRLTDSEVETRITALGQRNERFVRESLFADLRTAFRDILTDPTLPAKQKREDPKTAREAVERVGESGSSRASMYAFGVWGVAHRAFADEMQAAEVPLRWVLTSLEPCDDCPTLMRNSPYGRLNPLPTVPGAGDTSCLSNCLCLLSEVEPDEPPPAEPQECSPEEAAHRLLWWVEGHKVRICPDLPSDLPEAPPGEADAPKRRLPAALKEDELPDVPFSPRNEIEQIGAINKWRYELELKDQALGGSMYRMSGAWQGNSLGAEGLFMQAEVMEMANVPVVYTGMADEQVAPAIERGLARYPNQDVARKTVRAIYDLTQQTLKAGKVKTMTVYRGMRLKGEFEVGEDVEVEQNPLSSWSRSPAAAKHFASGGALAQPIGRGVVLMMEVPVEDVYATSTVLTGLNFVGVQEEKEIVVIARRGRKATVSSMHKVSLLPPAEEAPTAPRRVLVEGPKNSRWLELLRRERLEEDAE
jgi:hypothetical protein